MQHSAQPLAGSEEALEVSAAKKSRVEAAGARSGAPSPAGGAQPAGAPSHALLPPSPPPSTARQLQIAVGLAFSGIVPVPLVFPRMEYAALESVRDGAPRLLRRASSLEDAMRAVRERALAVFGDELLSYCLYCCRALQVDPDDRETCFDRYSAWVASGRAAGGEDLEEEEEAFVGFEAAFARLQAGKAGAEADFGFDGMQDDGAAAMFFQSARGGGGGGGGAGAGGDGEVCYCLEFPQHPEPDDEMRKEANRAAYMVVTIPLVLSCTSAQLRHHISQQPCLLGSTVHLEATVADIVASFVGPPPSPPMYLAVSYVNNVKGCCNSGLTVTALGAATTPQEARRLLRRKMPPPPFCAYIGEQEGAQGEAGEEQGEGGGEGEQEDEDEEQSHKSFDGEEIQGAIDALTRGDSGIERLFDFSKVRAEREWHDSDDPRSWREKWKYSPDGEGIAAKIRIKTRGSNCGGTSYSLTTFYCLISC